MSNIFEKLDIYKYILNIEKYFDLDKLYSKFIYFEILINTDDKIYIMLCALDYRPICRRYTKNYCTAHSSIQNYKYN